MTGFAINSRKPPFNDWRVREALLLAFNFEYINDTITGGAQSRISSYFSGSDLAFQPGPAEGRVADLLAPFKADLLPGTLEGYELPKGDGSERNRRNLRKAVKLLSDAGWQVEDGELRNREGEAFTFDILIRQGDTDMQTAIEIYARALERLGIKVAAEKVDNAQYTARLASLDFDMTPFRRALSLSPGNEQRLYWGSAGAHVEGTRNVMGVESLAVDAMIDAMLAATSREDFVAATRALDRILTAGRYVIPIWDFDVGRIAHAKELRFPDTVPIYGDGPQYMPDVLVV